jgi:hypothetical protein
MKNIFVILKKATGMKLLITLSFCLIGTTNLAQMRLNISSGVTNAKGKYGADWSNTFTVKTALGWAVNSAIEIPLSKKVALYNTLEFAHKKFSYSTPAAPDFGFERTENCAYISIKPAIHFLLIGRKEFAVMAGPGLFGSLAISGKYSEAGSTIAGPYSVKGNLKIGNEAGNSYKSADAGISLQVIARYKKFSLPVMADFSFTNNIPGKNAATRKWQSMYAGIGYSFLFKNKK